MRFRIADGAGIVILLLTACAPAQAPGTGAAATTPVRLSAGAALDGRMGLAHATLSRYSRDCGGCLRIEYDTATVVVDRHPDKPAITNIWAAVRAVGNGGHRSLAAVVPPPAFITR